MPASAAAPSATEEKKRKKEKKSSEPEPEFYISPEEKAKAFEETKHLFSLSNKKKSKKRMAAGENAHGLENEAEDDQYHKYLEVALGQGDHFQILDRVYKQIQEKNPEFGNRKKHMMSAPHVARVGTTKTCWVNFVDHCNKMNRDYKHVLSFVLSELGTDGSLDGKNQLIIKGKYTSKKLESILKKYIGMYVACNDCRSPNTVLERDHINKLYFVICKSCGSKRSVAAIKTGYHAVKKGERYKSRQ